MLADLAVTDEATFKSIVDQAKNALESNDKETSYGRGSVVNTIGVIWFGAVASSTG